MSGGRLFYAQADVKCATSLYGLSHEAIEESLVIEVLEDAARELFVVKSIRVFDVYDLLSDDLRTMRVEAIAEPLEAIIEHRREVSL